MILHLIFGKQVFKEMRRDLLTNIVSLAGKKSSISKHHKCFFYKYFFTAGLGGIYSLFIGMSVITFFEIVYFFTIRLWATYTELKEADQTVDTFRKRQRKLQMQINQVTHQ